MREVHNKNNNTPEIITLSHDDLKKIKARFLSNKLEEHDRKIILTIITTYQWLQDKLANTKINIFRLRKLFGFKTEKRTQLAPANYSNSNVTEATQDPTTQRDVNESDKDLTLKK